MHVLTQQPTTALLMPSVEIPTEVTTVLTPMAMPVAELTVRISMNVLKAHMNVMKPLQHAITLMVPMIVHVMLHSLMLEQIPLLRDSPLLYVMTSTNVLI